MTKVSKCGALAIMQLVVFSVLSTSCSGDQIYYPIPLVVKRTVISQFSGMGSFDYADGCYTATTPFTLCGITGCQGEHPGRDDGRTDIVTQIEFDFDDGSGWQDVTAIYQSWTDDISTWVQHTYTTPGEYDPTVRITYWDGEVVYQHPDLAKHVIVTAAE